MQRRRHAHTALHGSSPRSAPHQRHAATRKPRRTLHMDARWNCRARLCAGRPRLLAKLAAQAAPATEPLSDTWQDGTDGSDVTNTSGKPGRLGDRFHTRCHRGEAANKGLPTRRAGAGRGGHRLWLYLGQVHWPDQQEQAIQPPARQDPAQRPSRPRCHRQRLGLRCRGQHPGPVRCPGLAPSPPFPQETP